jgi:NAD+ synthase (glutamine-hydrolysing)
VPSAELSEAQDVTKGLGDPIKYGYHDALLRQLIEYRHHAVDVLGWFLDGSLLSALEWKDVDSFRRYFPDTRSWLEDLEWVTGQLQASYFKRIQAPPVIIVSKRAFGFDLRESQLPMYTPGLYEQRRKQVLASPIEKLTATS